MAAPNLLPAGASSSSAAMLDAICSHQLFTPQGPASTLNRRSGATSASYSRGTSELGNTGKTNSARSHGSLGHDIHLQEDIFVQQCNKKRKLGDRAALEEPELPADLSNMEVTRDTVRPYVGTTFTALQKFTGMKAAGEDELLKAKPGGKASVNEILGFCSKEKLSRTMRLVLTNSPSDDIRMLAREASAEIEKALPQVDVLMGTYAKEGEFSMQVKAVTIEDIEATDEEDKRRTNEFIEQLRSQLEERMD
mmetsp:Transcript_36790/g.66140  ORF Transcript_36790/g.66140 Transcript_36790/m.66140 type:complete len:251 (-) Transcript_36790:825-1577(-)